MDIKYIIFDLTELDKINKHDIISLRIGKTKGIVKYSGELPSFFHSIKTKSIEYTNQQIIDMIGDDEWLVTNINPNEIVSGSLV